MIEKDILIYKIRKLLNEDAGSENLLADFILELVKGNSDISDVKQEIIDEKSEQLAKIEELKVSLNNEIVDLNQ